MLAAAFCDEAAVLTFIFSANELNTLDALPTEILEVIFLRLQNLSLSQVWQRFRQILSDRQLRVHLCIRGFEPKYHQQRIRGSFSPDLEVTSLSSFLNALIAQPWFDHGFALQVEAAAQKREILGTMHNGIPISGYRLGLQIPVYVPRRHLESPWTVDDLC